MPGRALIITGPSGVGKTAVALHLQHTLEEPWLFYEVDRAQPRLPKDRPDFATIENERRMRRAVLGAARAYLDAGFSLIIEVGLFGETDRGSVDESLAGIDTTVVVLSCSRSTLEHRLNERTSRVDKAWARKFYERFAGVAIESSIVVPTDDRSVSEVSAAVAGHVGCGVDHGA